MVFVFAELNLKVRGDFRLFRIIFKGDGVSSSLRGRSK